MTTDGAEVMILGKFGHHPDPATDFEVEVECLIGMDYEVRVGFADADEFVRRMEVALAFRVGGDAGAVAAKGMLRDLAVGGHYGIEGQVL